MSLRCFCSDSVTTIPSSNLCKDCWTAFWLGNLCYSRTLHSPLFCCRLLLWETPFGEVDESDWRFCGIFRKTAGVVKFLHRNYPHRFIVFRRWWVFLRHWTDFFGWFNTGFLNFFLLPIRRWPSAAPRNTRLKSFLFWTGFHLEFPNLSLFMFLIK